MHVREARAPWGCFQNWSGFFVVHKESRPFLALSLLLLPLVALACADAPE